MRAFLYRRDGSMFASMEVDHPPPLIVVRRGMRFERLGSEAHFTDDDVEWLGWSYLELWP